MYVKDVLLLGTGENTHFEIKETSELLQGSKDPCERSRRAKTC